MQRRYSLAHFILASVVALVLTPSMVDAAPQAQIVFTSERDVNLEIFVMDADGKNQQRLTTNRYDDGNPAWFDPALAVVPAGKTFTMWGWLKQVNR